MKLLESKIAIVTGASIPLDSLLTSFLTGINDSIWISVHNINVVRPDGAPGWQIRFTLN